MSTVILINKLLTDTNTLYDRTDEDISMQVCEPYELHKTKPSKENERVYDECQTSPDATDTIYEL